LFLYLLPLVAISRVAPRSLRGYVEHLLNWVVDIAAGIFLRECDVFIGMSGLCVRSAQAARGKYGAKIFIERGSRHILSQKEILDLIPNSRRETVSNFSIKRELWAYEYADVIVIPSHHTEESFAMRGIPQAKLFRNPYGVDLTMFPPTQRDTNRNTILFVGTWSLRKGCEVLWAACEENSSWHLLHVGPVGDAPQPNSPRFEHCEPVEQANLVEFYRRSHVFAHASREEGLSLVQAQALACGLPLVCTDRTGGADLQELLNDPKYVTVVPPDDVAALSRGIEKALAISENQTGLRDILGPAREKFSWSAYGRRYADEIERCLKEKDDALG